MYRVVRKTPPRMVRAATHKAQTEIKLPAVKHSGPLFSHFDASIKQGATFSVPCWRGSTIGRKMSFSFSEHQFIILEVKQGSLSAYCQTFKGKVKWTRYTDNFE